MRLSFLKAGNGDCIHISELGHHIIVDSGEVCMELESLISSIMLAKENIDLLVITHYDADHINGICSILKNMKPVERRGLIKKVWFNGTKTGLRGNEKLLSATDATFFGKMLLESNIAWISELKSGMTERLSDRCFIELLEGGAIFKQEAEGQRLGGEKCDWNTSLNILEKYVDDKSLDKSGTNAQSAIILLHAGEKIILLPGDATPEILSKALDDYRGDGKTKFQLIKLPHHGSYKNITKDILDNIECSDYVISTDGSKYYHPNKKTMLKVVKWGHANGETPFIFHMNYYDELFEKLNISESDMKHYGFSCDGKREFEF